MFVTSKKRSPALPDVPALPELGFKFADVDLEFWWGLFVPKGVPEPIRAKLEKALQATMANPAVRERLAQGRHRSVVRHRRGAAGQARERDQELVEVHRRQGHQGRAVVRSPYPEMPGLVPGIHVLFDVQVTRRRAMAIDFTVNGRSVSVAADGSTPLLTVLRDELGLRGTKFGCGTEQCGACMVLIDGEPAYSCTREVGTLAGKSVTTVEGLSHDGALSPLQQAFLDEQAGQCGYCLSGILVSATALLEEKAEAEPRRHRRGARSASVPLRHPQPRGPRRAEGERMIRKSGHRFSEKIVRKGKAP